MNSLLIFTASATGRYYLDVGAYNDGGSGGYRLGISEVAAPTTPTYTLDQIADYLINGYWGSMARIAGTRAAIILLPII